MKTKHEVMFYALMAVATFIGNACADDTLTLASGNQRMEWTGDLLTLRWGTHQIEFDAETQDNWTDHDSIFNGAFVSFDPWTIDVMYNHLLHHIPMMCHVEVVTRLPEMQYDVKATCRD